LSYFHAIGFLLLIRAEMIIQAVWAWRPGRLCSVNITIPSSAGGNCWMLRAAWSNYFWPSGHFTKTWQLEGYFQ